MSANIITLTRVLLAMVTLVMFQMGFYFRVAALPLMIIVFYMDSLDGYVARKLGIASDFGALFDITGDRIVEHVYWIFFTAVGLVNFWVPIIFISRSFLVDTSGRSTCRISGRDRPPCLSRGHLVAFWSSRQEMP